MSALTTPLQQYGREPGAHLDGTSLARQRRAVTQLVRQPRAGEGAAEPEQLVLPRGVLVGRRRGRREGREETHGLQARTRVRKGDDDLLLVLTI